MEMTFQKLKNVAFFIQLKIFIKSPIDVMSQITSLLGSNLFFRMSKSKTKLPKGMGNVTPP